MTDKRFVTIGMILTDEEIAKAVEIFKTDEPNFHKRVLEELIEPNMDRINKSLGQANNAGFIAYMVEYVMLKAFPKNYPPQ